MSRTPQPSRGHGGRGARKSPAGRPGSGEGLHPPWADAFLGPGSRSRASPRRRKRKEAPPAPAPSVPPQPACPGLAPSTHTRVLSTRSSRTFPTRPWRPRPSHAPALQPFETPLPHSSPLPWRGRKAAMPGRPDRLLRGRLTCPSRTGRIGRGLAPHPGGSTRDRPGPGLRAKLGGPRSAAGWAPRALPRQPAATGFGGSGWGPPPPAEKGAIDPSVDGPGSPACFSHGIYSKRPEAPKRKRLAGKGLKES